MASRRLFLAVPVIEKNLIALINIQTEWGATLKLPPSHYVPKENLHLTLHFLGQVDEEKIAMLMDRLDKMAKLVRFSVELTETLLFPRVENPKVIALGGSPGLSPLSHLQSKLGVELQALGFSIESRIFIPHVSLFRLKNETWKKQDLPKGVFTLPVEAFALFESRTEMGRSRYEVVKTWNLK